MQQNINPYDEKEFKKTFIDTELYKSVLKDCNHISWKWFHFALNTLDPLHVIINDHKGPSRSYYHRLKIFSVVPFYYINFLLEQNPKHIYDLGCGDNIFKKYIPNIIGVDKEPAFKNVDIYRSIDTDFINEHQNYFDSVMSINGMHFQPFEKLRNVINDFISIVKPGGRGFITLNVARMLDESNNSQRDSNYIDNQIRTMLYDLNCNLLVFDVDVQHLDAPLDGNIRIVFEK